MITVQDMDGNNYKIEILFKHYDYNFGKNYLVYLEDNDLLASIYEEKDGQIVIDDDLSTEEYDMIDKVIEVKLGENNV